MPKDAQYWRDYRARKKQIVVTKEEVDEVLDDAVAKGHISQESRDAIQVLAAEELPDPLDQAQDALLKVEAILDAPLRRRTDRDRGLPRSNYYGPTTGKDGWQRTIQRADQKTIDAILDRVVTKKKPL